MQDAGGGWWWVVIDILAVVILGIAIAYGVIVARRRRTGPRTEQARREAVKELYDDKR
jgi:hypothetical protein